MLKEHPVQYFQLRRGFVLTMLLMTLVMSLGSQAFAQRLLASEETHGFGFGYGDTRWDNFSAEIDRWFTEVDIVPQFNDLSLMLEYDALLVQLRTFTSTLSPTEVANLQAYIATGRKVMLIGENSTFATWSRSVLSVVGAPFVGEGGGIFNVANPHPILTDGVSTLDMPTYCGVTSGGYSLFDTNFATLWGDPNEENVLTVLDVNIMEDDRWTVRDAAKFAANMAEWLGTGGSEPDPNLAVSGNCPGTNTFEVTNVTPNAQIAIVYGFGNGPTQIPPSFPCAGTSLNVGNPNLDYRVVTANGSGVAVLNTFVPAAACGRVKVQALDLSDCETSNVIGL